MHRAELANEFSRLFRGFGKDPDRELTHERLHALFGKWGHVPLGSLSEAVDDLLLGTRFPTRTELQNALDGAVRSFRPIRQTQSGPVVPYYGAIGLDGRWHEVEPFWDPGLRDFMEKLVMGRRWHWDGDPPIKASPAYYVEMIRSSNFSETFGKIESWQELQERSLWPLAPTTNAASEMVKRGGWGSLPGYWDEQAPGRWEPDKIALAAHRSIVGGNSGTILPPNATENGF